MSLGVLGDPACPITSQGVALLGRKLGGWGHFLSGYILTRFKCQCKHLHPGLKSCRAPWAGGAVSQWCDRQVSYSFPLYPLIYKDLIGVIYVDKTYPITLQARGDEGKLWLLRPGPTCRISFWSVMLMKSPLALFRESRKGNFSANLVNGTKIDNISTTTTINKLCISCTETTFLNPELSIITLTHYYYYYFNLSLCKFQTHPWNAHGNFLSTTTCRVDWLWR